MPQWLHFKGGFAYIHTFNSAVLSLHSAANNKCTVVDAVFNTETLNKGTEVKPTIKSL